MTRRAATTVLLITRNKIVRADFTSGRPPTLAELWQQPRPELDDAGLLVETALLMGPRPGRRVWVFSSDFWSQTVALPTARTMGLSAGDLAGALNFEAEPLSGLSAFESVVGHTPVKSAGGESVYWIVQFKSNDRDRVDEVVRKAGSRLAGLGHPGGLPRPLDPAAQTAKSWERIELWPDNVAYLHGNGKGMRDVHFLNIDPQQGRWQGAVEKLRAEFFPSEMPEHREILSAQTRGANGQPELRLDNPDVLRQWLTAWAVYLDQRPTDVPVVRPAARPLSAGLRGAFAVLGALLAAGVCAAHYFLFMEPQTASMRAELQQVQEPAKTLTEIDKRSAELEKKRAAALKQEAKLRQDNETLGRQRQRLAVLLRCLAEYCGEDVVIQKIGSTAGEPRIIGMCLRPELADQFAHKLTQALDGHGWQVNMAHKQALIVQANGAPWSFELHLHETSISGPSPTPTRPAAVARR